MQCESDFFNICCCFLADVIRRTIYEYHRVEIPLAQVQEAGAIVLTPEVCECCEPAPILIK